MLPIKVYLWNAWMKSHTLIHTKNNPLRNHVIKTVEVSLTDNHHLRATVMIQRSTTRWQRILDTPPKELDLNCLMDPLVNCENKSSKKYDPFLPMVTNMVYWVYELSELSPILVLNTTPKNILTLMFKNILILWFEISAQNLAFKKLSWKS